MRLVEQLDDVSDEEYARLVPRQTRLLAYRGSHTHGTYIAPTDPDGHDDTDLISVYTDMRASSYFGTDGQVWTGREAKVGQWDGVSYQLQHFAKLAAACNPNVIQALWLRAEHYLLMDWMGTELIAHRDLFTSRLAAKSFGGYAYGQLKRMTAFNFECSVECPCDGEFHVDDCPLRAARGRGSAKLYATGFMGAKRKGLVAKHGYDVKNASHLIRLLRMAIELLDTGKIFVWRNDAAELIAIKRGEWTLERVQAEANTLFGVLEERRYMSPLPETPDFGAINAFVTRIMCRAMIGTVERLAY